MEFRGDFFDFSLPLQDDGLPLPDVLSELLGEFEDSSSTARSEYFGGAPFTDTPPTATSRQEPIFMGAPESVQFVPTEFAMKSNPESGVAFHDVTDQDILDAIHVCSSL